MRTLVLDIETSPNLAWVWGLWQQNIGAKSGQLVQSTGMLCFGAKWHGERSGVQFHRGEGMVGAAWRLLDEAEVVVGWNNKNFDDKHLRREIVEAGMPPPSPFESVDLMQVVKRQFKMPSNSLEYVSQRLLGKGKAPTGGFDLWLGVMQNDPKAWAKMERYQRRDVTLTDAMYTRLLPWIEAHPNVALHDGKRTGCPNCGSSHVQGHGFAYTRAYRYHRYLCTRCGRVYRGSKSIPLAD